MNNEIYPWIIPIYRITLKIGFRTDQLYISKYGKVYISRYIHHYLNENYMSLPEFFDKLQCSSVVQLDSSGSFYHV